MGVVERDSNGCTTVGQPCTYKYDYDDQGRLWKVWKYDWLATAYDLEKTYEYDANGNRTKLDWADPAKTDEVVPTVSGGAFDIGPRDEVGSYGERTNIEYNDDGQTEKWVVGDDEFLLKYDRADHLLSYTRQDEPTEAVELTVEYRYDAAGRRVERIEDDTTTHRWVWRGSRLIAEYAGTGSMTLRKQFVYAEFPHVPSVIIDHSSGSAVKYRVVHDQLGSVRKVVSMADGTVVQELKYDEFGRVEQDSNEGFQPFGFAGGLYDPTTKITRFGVRDYDAYLGRWLTQDPLSFGAGDTNLYRYVYGSPLVYIDVDGRHPVIALYYLTKTLAVAAWSVVGPHVLSAALAFAAGFAFNALMSGALQNPDCWQGESGAKLFRESVYSGLFAATSLVLAPVVASTLTVTIPFAVASSFIGVTATSAVASIPILGATAFAAFGIDRYEYLYHRNTYEQGPSLTGRVAGAVLGVGLGGYVGTITATSGWGWGATHFTNVASETIGVIAEIMGQSVGQLL